jgi:LPS export ABC transporter protein LptC
MNLKPKCLLLLGWFSVLLLVAASGGCARKKAGKAVSAGRAAIGEYPSQESWNSSLIMTRAGKQQAIIRYGHMTQYDSRKMAYFDGGVQVDFYSIEGAHTSRLNSDRGEYNQLTEEVRGIGKVTVVSDTGITLRTPFMRWDPRIEKIVSDSSVMVTTRKLDTLYGKGFESVSDLSHWVIMHPTGITDKHVNFDKIESEFSKPAGPAAPGDSIPRPAPEPSGVPDRPVNPDGKR